MFWELEWSDLRSERSGGRTLSNTVRIALVVCAFAAGVVAGELVQEGLDLIAYSSPSEEVEHGPASNP
jgi:hypothetical protein